MSKVYCLMVIALIVLLGPMPANAQGILLDTGNSEVNIDYYKDCPDCSSERAKILWLCGQNKKTAARVNAYLRRVTKEAEAEKDRLYAEYHKLVQENKDPSEIVREYRLYDFAHKKARAYRDSISAPEFYIMIQMMAERGMLEEEYPEWAENLENEMAVLAGLMHKLLIEENGY